MYNIDIITIFPDLFINFLENSIVKRAQIKEKVGFGIHNLRDYSDDKFRTVDDVPYGGGEGMLLKPEPFFRAVEDIKKESKNIKTIMLSPQGVLFSQDIAKDLLNKTQGIILLCGRYAGIDERVKNIVDLELSIGDYVLSGGELPAMVVSEAIVRLIPGVLGREESFKKDSFYGDYLDYPKYTRPEIFKGLKVPKVLLSGNHDEIEKWRLEKSIENTKIKRPDLLKKLKNK